ncbi:MAG: RDD family protein [Candidatus Limnocylindria bacterium]
MDESADQQAGTGAPPSPGGPPAQTAPTATTWAPPPRPPKPGPAPGIEYAGFWIRTAAYLIDSIPFLVVAFIFFVGPMMNAAFEAFEDIPLPPPGVSMNSPEYQAWNLLVTDRMNELMGGMYPGFALLQLFPIVYFVGFWTWLGQTPGMMIFGLRVARETDGTKPGLGRSFLRFVGYWLSWIALFIGFIWVAFDSRKQGWHDKIAGTLVVRRSG